MTPPRKRGDRQVPQHTHGSVYFYRKGCNHPLCRAAANLARQRARTKLRLKRRPRREVWPDGHTEIRLVHPDLAPPDSTEKARHGVDLARREHKCECRICQPKKRKGGTS